LDADPNLGFATYVQYPTFSKIISGRFLAAVNAVLGASLTTLEPTVPRADLVAIYLTGVTGVNKGVGGFVGEVMRLNTGIAAVSAANQNNLGIVGTVLSGGSDLAGFPNGRRPGDDVVDISLIVFMGAACTQAFLNASINICTQNAGIPLATAIPIGGVPLQDGSPVNAGLYQTSFPYFNTPTPGSYLDGGAGNVVQNATVCYTASQHGRCPVCSGGSTTTGSATTTSATTTGSTGSTTCSGTSLIPLSLLAMIAAIALSLLFM